MHTTGYKKIGFIMASCCLYVTEFVVIPVNSVEKHRTISCITRSSSLAYMSVVV